MHGPSIMCNRLRGSGWGRRGLRLVRVTRVGGGRGGRRGVREAEGDFRVLKDGETERMEGDRKREVRG